MSKKSTSTTALTVAITGTVQIPLLTNVLRSLDEFGMQQEIACEAVKLSVAEKLGGFEEMTVRPAAATNAPGPKASYTCTIQFDALSACVKSVLAEHDRMTTSCRAIGETIAAVDMSQWATDPDYSGSILKKLAEIAALASSLDCETSKDDDAGGALQAVSAAGSSPSLNTEQPPPLVRGDDEGYIGKTAQLEEGGAQEGEHSSADGGEWAADECEERSYDDEEGEDPDARRAAMGYQRLLDDEDDDRGAPVGDSHRDKD